MIPHINHRPVSAFVLIWQSRDDMGYDINNLYL